MQNVHIFQFLFVFLSYLDSKDEFRPLKQVYNDVNDDSDNVKQSTHTKTDGDRNPLFPNKLSVQKDNFHSLQQSDSDV